MAIEEQTLEELKTQCLANKESELSVNVPTSPRSFLRVESVVQAGQLKSLEKRAVYAQRACLASTAMLEGLKVIGRDHELEQNPAVKTQLNLIATAAGGSSVTAGDVLTSDATGAYYKVNSTVGELGGTIEYIVTAQDAGEDANLDDGETLTFASPLTGVTDPSIVDSTEVVGAEKETIEEFRRRVLAAQRAAGGGGNTFDYRERAEQVSGVLRAYPYSGRPITFEYTSPLVFFYASDNSVNIPLGSWAQVGLGTVYQGDILRVIDSTYNDGIYTVQSATTGKIVVVESILDESAGANLTLRNHALPGDRTVFIESNIVADEGVPDDDLLDAVREHINEGDDEIAWPDLGDIDSTLYVEPIERISFYVEVYNLSIDPAQEDEAKSKVVEDLETYFEGCRMFIPGLDYEMDRTDTITDLAVSKVVQGVLESYGASGDGIVLRVGAADAETLTSYQLGQGQLAKLALVFDNEGETWS